MPSRKKNEKDHRNRKSQGSAEVWRKQKKARNAARQKQRLVKGNWTREEFNLGPMALTPDGY